LKNNKKFIVAIDQGTTSSRAILFNSQGKSLFKSSFFKKPLARGIFPNDMKGLMIPPATLHFIF